MGNAAIYNRLAKLGLREAAETYKEEVRKRLRADTDDRKAANIAAETAMWDTFGPVVERLEADKTEGAAAIKTAQDEAKAAAPEPPSQLPGLPAAADVLLDPNYNESDPGKQLRDGLLWVVMGFFRVIRDTVDGPVANLDAARMPPPNDFALFTLSTYALSPVDKRRELISRALGFAEKGHDAPSSPTGEGDGGGGFLGDVG